ncbi:MAG TPA: alkaline phosphatase D family protein, partial [Candidatus Krumholzibacteria bacterium]|nr:alkaline phosphatase D family protein [Candidatus Krumholzibacteria bacterium]
VMNNWFPGMDLSQDDRYTEKNADLLAARARQALFEFVPIRRSPDNAERIYRSRVYGDLVEVFMLDLRSYRGPNSSGRQTVRDASTSMLGDPQFAWLKEALRASQATWKIIATDLPLGLVVQDYPRNGQPAFEAWANGDDGVPLGRELELAQLLSFMKREGIHNTIWITADVHYGAAHHYSPERAAFTDFDPFWELVAGPMNAGTYGPNTLDHTFGPEVRFLAIPEGMKPNRPPSAGFQFFGVLEADPTTRVLTMSLHDIEGTRLWSEDLEPVGG